ncbi:CvpA family protein [Pseudoflavonifractor sp. MSJ-37]|uniref:CvpA family protein n=1 Tax=Pseudoflavonifractor sp. MSJ-37 TaxID=2841531 RepID=UPI001C1144A3|nr:CvpA family protein [Pseudoflavonifractor sp. MSJ-37]MBU5434890.1 CvpA family protein [Pseudoflavonifractor sp. MSJ-37]
MSILLDLIVSAVLIFFVVRGASKGLVRTLCGLAAVVVAVMGASFIAKTASPMVGEAIQPRLAAAIEERLDQEIQTRVPDLSGALDSSTDGASLPLQSVLDTLKDMGFYQDLIDKAEDALQQGMTAVAADTAARAAASMAQALAYRILFSLSFALILLLWGILSHALDLMTRLPVLHSLNQAGGALLGLLEALLILFVVAWLLQSLGQLIPEETVEQTYLLRLLMGHDPISLLDGLSALAG